uniref:Uncharacterized protein n=1 Tax=Chromera velia CCMP2878 TaxID=1169474 RepID=A0A0G4GL76_9ALVE|eukprot:Cvel_4852.t1-p1 / transcript=Cvel_4852.t1 / gene=Cvel_4852 / organism=Chromera_velia_CCMP2878 / gene_product=hypothetical protein / transcript_product=hypothetical protein / location=Cvel_scaffold219:122-1048(+) / protein_length=309 / sequence_SO=supercontig / SO=protein_coding / is_pseudo=false
MTQALHRYGRDLLLQQQSETGRARLRSCAGGPASAWLTAMPSSHWTTIAPTLFFVALRLRLGLNLPEIQRNPICACGLPLDLAGHHVQRCATGGGIWWRHEQVKDAFCNILSGVRHTYVSRERTFAQLGLFTPIRLVEEGQKRPDLLSGMPSGESYVGDVFVTHPMSVEAARLRRMSNYAGAAARDMEMVKDRKYKTICKEMGLEFVPLVFETYGRWGKKTVEFLSAVVNHAASRVRGGEDFAAVQGRIMQQYFKILSCTLQRFVAANVLSSIHSRRGRRGPFQAEPLLARDMAAFSVPRGNKEGVRRK